MSYSRNVVTRDPKPSKKNLKKKKEKMDQVQNIISLRINDDERRALEKLTKSTSKNISEIMREAIAQWSMNRRKLCLD